MSAKWVGGLLSNPYVLFENPKLQQEETVRAEKKLKRKILPHVHLRGVKPELVVICNRV